MASVRSCADHQPHERARPPLHRGRPLRDVARGLGRRRRGRDRGVSREARRVPQLPGIARVVTLTGGAAGNLVDFAAVKLSYLWKGLPGHPIHPPLTDATIGVYTFATIAALADVTGISNNAATHGWWLALLAGLIFTVPTALSGLAD